MKKNETIPGVEYWFTQMDRKFQRSEITFKDCMDLYRKKRDPGATDDSMMSYESYNEVATIRMLAEDSRTETVRLEYYQDDVLIRSSTRIVIK